MSQNTAREEFGSRHRSAHASADTVLRTTGLISLMGIAIIHFVQLVPTMRQTPFLGVSFVLLIIGSVLVGARLIVSRTSPARLWGPVALLGIAAVLGYILTRAVSTPLDTQDVGNWSCMLGMAALFVEGSLVGLGLLAVWVTNLHRPSALLSPARRTVGREADAVLLPIRATNGSRRT